VVPPVKAIVTISTGGVLVLLVAGVLLAGACASKPTAPTAPAAVWTLSPPPSPQRPKVGIGERPFIALGHSEAFFDTRPGEVSLVASYLDVFFVQSCDPKLCDLHLFVSEGLGDPVPTFELKGQPRSLAGPPIVDRYHDTAKWFGVTVPLPSMKMTECFLLPDGKAAPECIDLYMKSCDTSFLSDFSPCSGEEDDAIGTCVESLRQSEARCVSVCSTCKAACTHEDVPCIRACASGALSCMEKAWEP
jgi:hypothetical protein